MKIEEMKAAISEHSALTNEMTEIALEIAKTNPKALMAKAGKLMITGKLTPVAMGLPVDSLEKIQRYVELSRRVNDIARIFADYMDKQGVKSDA